MQQRNNTRRTIHVLAQATTVLSIALAALSAGAQQHRGHEEDAHFWPGNLVVSRSVYDNNPANVTVGAVLPPNCASTQGGCGAPTGAIADGTYPFVFNNTSTTPASASAPASFLTSSRPTATSSTRLKFPIASTAASGAPALTE
jgi:hypothetical protein